MSDLLTLTRENLYALVWEKPIAHLAKEWSMSDVGLAKLCARHDVPTPPRGYWEKLAAGQTPARPALPAVEKAVPIQVRVTRPEDRFPAIDEELAAALGAEALPEKVIMVAERLQAPCPPVQAATLSRSG